MVKAFSFSDSLIHAKFRKLQAVMQLYEDRNLKCLFEVGFYSKKSSSTTSISTAFSIDLGF
jgi:hypothetical protein